MSPSCPHFLAFLSSGSTRIDMHMSSMAVWYQIRSGLYTRRTYRSSLYCWLALGNDFIRRGGTFEGLSILNMSMHALLVAMLAFLAWIYLKRILRYRSNPLACLPGPPGGSLMKGLSLSLCSEFLRSLWD